jgi:hypothetical protein
MTQNELFEYVVEKIVDSEVLRYQIPEWEALTLKKKKNWSIILLRHVFQVVSGSKVEGLI